MCQGLRKQTEPNINGVLAEVVSQSTVANVQPWGKPKARRHCFSNSSRNQVDVGCGAGSIGM